MRAGWHSAREERRMGVYGRTRTWESDECGADGKASLWHCPSYWRPKQEEDYKKKVTVR